MADNTKWRDPHSTPRQHYYKPTFKKKSKAASLSRGGTHTPLRDSILALHYCSIYSKSSSTDKPFNVPNPIHVYHKAPIPEESTSPRLSPTISQMQGEINVITKKVNIDLDSLENDILEPENKDKLQWYLQLDPLYRDRIRQEWIHDIYRLNTPFDFFCWLEYFTTKLGFTEDPFTLSYINVQTSLARKWKLHDGSQITQIHPPLQTIRLDTPAGELFASPFKKGKDGDDSVNIDDIKKIYHQNNYSNQILYTIAKQVDSLSTDLKSIPRPNISRFPDSYSSPHFQPSTLSKDQEAKLKSSSSSAPIQLSSSPLLTKISQTLDRINLNLPSTSKINTIAQDDDSDISPSTDNESSSSANTEALAACQDLKFQAKYGSTRTELGSFCEAFGITDQKELIFDIIQKLRPETQKKQLEKLKDLILKGESSSARLVEPFSISKMFERYPHMNPQIKQTNTKELQTEIQFLKSQIKELKERVFSIETKNLELDTQIAVLQSKIPTV
ncbi:hypothetical protein M9H77_01900 [Catharanthus roseus]|uniref:Uncharacterized protein n=1 Tax=Catharanthus roseus TaxID=4058 RepID=A0ACC0C7A2_CATRO|nr:hypothetical protein M9H77_01900 [Catharanthus roseus]